LYRHTGSVAVAIESEHQRGVLHGQIDPRKR
jgi:hypothetical protein